MDFGFAWNFRIFSRLCEAYEWMGFEGVVYMFVH